MTKFKFVSELPPIQAKKPGPVTEQFANALRNRPNTWAVWPRTLKNAASAYSVAGALNRGIYKAFPNTEFEAAARGSIVYVRYTGAIAQADVA